ncbi:DUF2617 family protein [Blastococcus sp. TF02A_35]|uniref:DUF2617 family protein n=1 Tax=Blastococcus sp. TF02A-35 TaxID=2559612 RepID=UPI0010738322|nr:DUF2617 family protein [Blastococcus sp. TF02A_35]TFV48199.1 DUF2617 family protein [Blastococcus sp. TF02A_35]
MTLHLLTVEPRDVAAAALGLLLDRPAPAALAELRLSHDAGGEIVLGVLGASHVVTAVAGGRRLTEEISCDAVGAGGEPLPRHRRSAGYELSSAVTRTTRAELDATADRLRARAATEPGWLLGAFPGGVGALTALTARPLAAGGWTWDTWHLYPDGDTGEVVTTSSRWAP